MEFKGYVEGDFGKMSDAICEILDDPETRKQMGLKNGFITEKMSLESISVVYYKLYKEIV